MATLLITKKSNKVWLHTPSDELQFIIGKFTFSIDGDFFQIVELGQSKRNQYSFTDITIYDETTDTTYNSFASITDLSLQLETLGYIGFITDGETFGVNSVNGLTGTVVLNGTNISVVDPTTSLDATLNDALANINAGGGGGGSQDLQDTLINGNNATGIGANFLDSEDVGINTTIDSQGVRSQDTSNGESNYGTQEAKVRLIGVGYSKLTQTAIESSDDLEENKSVLSYGVVETKTTDSGFSSTITQINETPTENGSYVHTKPNKNGIYAMIDDIPPAITIDATPTDGSSNAVSSNGVFDALATKVPYTGATTDVDLGTNGLDAKFVKIKGTAGDGKLALKHQSAPATASASESIIYADSSGNPKWKNDGNAVQDLEVQSNKSTNTSLGTSDTLYPSQKAVKSYVDTQDGLLMAKSANGSDIANIATFRANLGVDKLTSNGNSDYTILSTDKAVVTSATLTDPRTFTLPLANSVNAGYEIIVADLFGGVSSTNTLTVTRSGSNTINGATSVVIGAQYGMRRFISDGSSRWTFDAGVMRISDYIGTTLTPSVLVATDSNSKLQPLSTATYPSLTELSYGKGVTSAIQTQLDNRVKYIVKDLTSSSNVTGTTSETLCKTYTIDANTFSTSDFMNVIIGAEKTAGVNGGTGYTVRLKINSTNNFATATTILTCTPNQTQNFTNIQRHFEIKSTTIKGIIFSSSLNTDFTNNGNLKSSTAYDPTAVCYLYVSIQPTATSETQIISSVQITN